MNTGNLCLRVRCCAGFEGDQTPECFYLGEREVGVEDVIDRWLSPGHRYFKVLGDDGGVYIISHDVASGRWELTMFDSGQREDLRLSSI